MDMKQMKNMGLSEKLSQLCALLSLVTLICYCIYGAIYDYFDSGVFLTQVLGVACAQVYSLKESKWTSQLNLAATACLSFSVGLFFLNSYPVWADRLNNIDMYGSRGTLVPVIAIILLLFADIFIEIASCFTLNRKDVRK